MQQAWWGSWTISEARFKYQARCFLGVVLQVWSQTRCGSDSITRELNRNADSWFPPWTHWMRNSRGEDQPSPSRWICCRLEKGCSVSSWVWVQGWAGLSAGFPAAEGARLTPQRWTNHPTFGLWRRTPRTQRGLWFFAVKKSRSSYSNIFFRHPWTVFYKTFN